MEDENIFVNGIEYDHRMTRAIKILVSKHNVSIEEAAAAISFFNGFFGIDVTKHADMFIRSAKKWNITVVQLINCGLEIQLDPQINKASRN
jgi:hypothetical protein